ncbi:MAG TPA: response regulator transcription factor [Acidimicrobiales bacterium]|nr:response regulator transcription factor [Acidimicrobiales bacterium]
MTAPVPPPAVTLAGRTDVGPILVVDDEESYREALSVGLAREGFRVVTAADADEALALLASDPPSVVLLDVMLPGTDGIELCRRLRTRSSVPVIMVTARAEEIDAVVGLEVGADHYVTKPYRLRELTARIRAVIRRTVVEGNAGGPGGGRPPATRMRSGATGSAVLEAGPVRIDAEARRAWVRGEEVSLRPREMALLQALVDNAGRVVLRRRLLDLVWGPDYAGGGKTLDIHIRQLRRAVELDPARPAVITTVRGVGYRFARDVE